MKRLWFILAIACLIICITTFLIKREPPQLVMRVLDVGQGDALYFRLPSGDDIVVDAGPDDRVLSQLGRYMPITDRTIELLIVSHNHQDHIGGLDEILGHYRVEHLWLSGAMHNTHAYKAVLQQIEAKRIPVTFVKAGDHTKVGDSELTVLHPPPGLINQAPEDAHDATIVFKLQYKQFCTIQTGDIEERHEQYILQSAAQLTISLQCPVLKVTHHGSRFGTSEPFLDAVSPKTALISVGTKNRYGHPAQELLDRLAARQPTIYRTDLQGTITLRTNGIRYSTKTEK